MSDKDKGKGKVVLPQDLAAFRAGKGLIGKYSFAVWDYIGPCQGDECPLNDVCTYKTTSKSKTKKCGIERYYIRTIVEPFAQLAQELKDPFIMHWIGLHLVPLYHHLVKFKKVERALSNPMDKTRMGDLRVHPIYREIRNTIKAIRTEWKTSGLIQTAKDEGYLGRLPSPLAGLEDDDLHGDGSYVSSLEADEDYEAEENEDEEKDDGS